jgi:hypothetical protein
MRRLVWIHAGRKRIMLVLSWRGSYYMFVLWLSHVQTLQFSYYFVVINASKRSLFSKSLCFTTAGVKHVLHFSVVYFSGSSGSLMPAQLSVENWVPLKPVLGVVRDVAFIHYPSCTDSIKPSLQFSCNFVVINASEGSLCFQIFRGSLLTSSMYRDVFYIFIFSLWRREWLL